MSKITILRKVYFTFFCLAITHYLNAQNSIQLVRDVWPGSYSSSPQDLTFFKDHLYFVAQQDFTGNLSVWKSDGTNIGTQAVFPIPDGMLYLQKSLLVKNDTLFLLTHKENSVEYTLWYILGDGTMTMPILTFKFFDNLINNLLVFKDKIWFTSEKRIGFITPTQDTVKQFNQLNTSILTFYATEDSLYWFGKFQQNAYVSNTALYRSDGIGFQLMFYAGSNVAGTNGSTVCDVTMRNQSGKVLWTVQNQSISGSGAIYPSGYAVGANGFTTIKNIGNYLGDAALCDNFLLVRALEAPSLYQSPTANYLIARKSNGVLDTLNPALLKGKLVAASEKVYSLLTNKVWVTDGTDVGTDSVSLNINITQNLMVPWKDKLLVRATGSPNKIWVIDFTMGGIFEVGESPDEIGIIQYPMWFDDCTLLFSNATVVHGRELWSLTLPPCVPPILNKTKIADDLMPTFSPNPSNSECIVQLNDQAAISDWEIAVYNQTGQPIWQETVLRNSTTFTIPTHALPNGLYFIQIKDKGRYVCKKLIVQH